MRKFLLSAAAAALMAAPALAETQGVTDDEILLGAHTDLSGIFAAFGAPYTQAAQQYFDEVNAKGGVHGRKIRYIVEDTGYQVPKAVQAANKLINGDKIFVMFGGLGTPHNMAAFKLQDRKGIPNVSPVSAGRQMLTPPAEMKFMGTTTYYDAIRKGVRWMSENEGSKKFCSMYIPSDFGLEVEEGTKEEVEALGLEFVGETTHKPDEIDFVGSLGKLKEAGCDTVTIALGLKQVITAIGTAKKIGWTDVKFLGSSAAFHTVVAKVPGGVTDGFYATAGWTDLEGRMDDPVVAAWVKDYTEASGESFPGTGALLGRSGAEQIVRALEAAGPDLTTEGFVAAMESLDYDDPIMGSHVKYSHDQHIGVTEVFVSRVEGEQWKVIGKIE